MMLETLSSRPLAFPTLPAPGRTRVQGSIFVAHNKNAANPATYGNALLVDFSLELAYTVKCVSTHFTHTRKGINSMARKAIKQAAKVCAAIYARVSTDEQIEGFGLDVQRANCEQYAAAYNIPVCNVYTDEGISGAKPVDKRPALSALMDAARAGEFNQVIVPAIDRLARDLKLFLNIWDDLEALGLKIILVKERLETDSATGMLMRNIMATFADYERALISERTTGGRRARAKTDGERGGSLPMGYLRTAPGKFGVDPLAAGLVRHIFSLRNAGNSYHVIAALLNAEGFTTQRGAQWAAASVRTIVLNEAKYKGASINESPVCWPVILN